MCSAHTMAAARVSETSGHGTVLSTSDDPTSTKILSALNLLAIHAGNDLVICAEHLFGCIKYYFLLFHNR